VIHDPQIAVAYLLAAPMRLWVFLPRPGALWCTGEIYATRLDPGGDPRLRLLSPADVDRLPPLHWLVKGCIPEHSFSLLYGPPGVGKSLLALDLAHSIGLGNSWLSFDTMTGSVIYVVAGEGGYGLRYRNRAWIQHNGSPIENVSYLLDPVQLPVPGAVDKFLKLIDPLEPDLILFDTLARCSVGMKENDTDGMGLAINGVDRIRDRTGAAVLLVHHATKPDKDGKISYRGSGALEAAVDVSIEVRRELNSKTRLLMICKKQKDAAEFKDVRWRMEPIKLKTSMNVVPVLR
jgi:putative DNA primase/helicase